MKRCFANKDNVEVFRGQKDSVIFESIWWKIRLFMVCHYSSNSASSNWSDLHTHIWILNMKVSIHLCIYGFPPNLLGRTHMFDVTGIGPIDLDTSLRKCIMDNWVEWEISWENDQYYRFPVDKYWFIVVARRDFSTKIIRSEFFPL